MNIYEKNIEALGKHHPELVELMESTIIDEDRIKVIPADNDLPRVLYRKEDGEEVYIHNAEDPNKCANQAVELLGEMEKEGVAILFGFGLGYFAEEILKEFEQGHILLVYEALPSLFKTTLMTRDISAILDSEKVKIILGDKIEDISSLKTYYNHIVNGQFWIVKHHPSVCLKEGDYEKFLRMTMDAKQVLDCGIGTAVKLGKNFINTFMANIPNIIRKPGVACLKDIFRGRPAIVVSGGPSLEKNFHLLNKVKGRAIIIAVDAVLPTLLPAGIIPDVVTGIDPTPEAIALFKDMPELKQVPFVCLPQYAQEVVNLYPGPVFVNSVPGNIIFQWLGSLWGDKGYVEAFGGSVAHFSFAVAEFMGSEVITLIGQDLSYADKYHAGETTRLLHDYLEEEVPDYRDGAQVIEDIFGEKRYTTGSLLSFKVLFENRFKTFKGMVINATEGGLPMEGTKIMRLADFLNEYCDLPEIDTFPVLSERTESELNYNLEGLLLQVKGAKSIFMDLKRKSKKILKYIHKLMKIKEKNHEDKPEYHNLLRKVEKLTDEFKHPLLDIIASYHYQLELYMNKQEMQEIDQIEDKSERLEKQLDRGLNYYGEIVEAIDLFIWQLHELINALELESRVNNVLLYDSMPKSERFFKAGMIYKKAGMATQAVKYLEAVRDDELFARHNTLQVNNLYISLAEMYMKQFRFYDAQNILTKGKGQGSGGKRGEKIAELFKVCDERIKEWNKRQEHFGKLIEDAEADYGMYLESGYFYFRVKDYEMAEKSYLKVVNSKESGINGESKSAAYYGLAHTYLAMDNSEKAVTALENAVQSDPSNPIFYRDLGIMAIENEDIEPAEIFLSKAIELAPGEAELYKPLVGLYMSLGEKEKAISLYEDALTFNPDNPVIQQELAALYKNRITSMENC